MAKLTMKSLEWFGKPHSWQKNYRETTLTVPPHTDSFAHAASLLAVSEQDIDAKASITVAPKGGECGVLVFQTPQSHLMVGCAATGFAIHYQALGYTDDTEKKRELPERIVMTFHRRKGMVSIGWMDGTEEKEITRASLPGVGTSYSFGYYFANGNDTPFTADLQDFSVTPLS